MRTELHYQGKQNETAHATSARAVANDDPTPKLIRIWQSVLGIDAITADQNYFDLGGDSALAVHLFAQIEKVFGVKLPLAILFDAPTIEGLARILREEDPTSGDSQLVAIQANGSRPPFFCMHGAGGNVLIYRDLARHLGPDQPFYGLQSRGLTGISEPLTTIEEMASLYVKEIQKFRPHGPYLLGGYCMGGTIAFEVAQQLRARGEAVPLLALFDTMNWCKVPRPSIFNKTLHAVQRLEFHAVNFSHLDFTGKRTFFREKAQALKSRLPVWRGMIAGTVSRGSERKRSESDVLANIWRTNDRACMNYRPRAYLGVVTDFRPARQYRIYDKPDAKWEALALRGQETIVLPVYPAGILVEPFVKHLADALTKSIDKAIAVHA
ncbi:MAG: hypothetical protein JOY93_05170 [Acidobacteriales bacterium]|nr:hypothetical protein [Terriglobales bacterium]